MEKRRSLTFRKLFGGCFLTLIALCLVLAFVSVLINRSMPQHLAVQDRLTDTDKARVAEALHLRSSFGEQIMPGFGKADIPVIIYNESYAFLIGMENPAKGWIKIPQRSQTGEAWEPVPGENFYGKQYFRQRLPNSKTTPQSFAVLVGDQYAASLISLEWMKIQTVLDLRDQVPEIARPVVPFPVFVSFLVPNSDLYIAAIDHESMHAYQGMRAAAKLDAAERTASIAIPRYPYGDQSFVAGWQAELNLLQQAVRAKSDNEVRDLAQKFLDQRASRRQKAGLASVLVDFERLKEWEEGIAKYTELSAYRRASSTAGYQPIAEITKDSQFKAYKAFQQKWDQEIFQIGLEARADGDMRFYYTGLSQALLLDRLSPGWKDRLFDDGAWLEDLLAEAVK